MDKQNKHTNGNSKYNVVMCRYLHVDKHRMYVAWIWDCYSLLRHSQRIPHPTHCIKVTGMSLNAALALGVNELETALAGHIAEKPTLFLTIP